MSEGEVYCIGCGVIINRRAEVCPECGMSQVPPGGWNDRGGGRSGAAQYEYEKLARKSKAGNVVLGFVLPPIAYLNLGKPLHAVVNVLTANFLLLGFICVPIHVYSIINTARKRVRRAGGGRR